MKTLNWIGWVALLAIGGCGNSEVVQDTSTANADASSQYVLHSEPSGAVPVGEARRASEGQQTVTLVGLIGGSADPFVDGLAAFTIVDPKVPFCASDEGCPTPWDYCCTQDQVRDNIATVKIVDESGAVVQGEARELLGVEELSTVVVEGTAERDDEGNLTVAATRVFVRPGA